MTTEQLTRALADHMVKEALTYCAETFFEGDIQRARQALSQGRRDICVGFSSSLGRQIAEYLGQMDKTVKAVYEYKIDPSTIRVQDEDFSPSRTIGINLVAWVERKNAAFSALAATLEKVLAESQKKIEIDDTDIAYTPLDIKMVDDDDVQEGRGYGVIIRSELVRSNQIWPHIQQPPRVVSWEPDQTTRDTLLEMLTSFDPSLAPENRILEHAFAIERIAPEERGPLEFHLTELKVALIRKIISDQLFYINIAKKWFSTDDLADLHQRRIGFGKIGGKAAGMILAARILNEMADDEVKESIQIPESYFLGSDLIYIFMAMNGLMYWNDQKYKPEERIRSEYAQIQKEFQEGEFPPEVIVTFRNILAEIGSRPLIVRSSSQLEDNFGTVFAGKYDSYFCPNQGSPEENLDALMNAISRTYASTLKPEALLYRRSKGLQDYDERMAILIQVVQGEPFGRYYLPHAAGVAFSRNLYRWSPEIRREDGFARLVWGLGTRAVGRIGDDYPRLVALSHPNLQPDDSVDAIRQYSQHYVDLIDLEENAFKSMPIHEVLTPRYGPLRFLVQIEQDGYFSTPRMRVSQDDVSRLAITFSEFLKRTPFPTVLTRILRTIETHYHSAVDLEFTVHIPDPRALDPQVKISLLQCRPQPHLQDAYAVRLPKGLPSEDVIFSTHYMVPRGYLSGIRYVLFVNPDGYYSLPSQSARNEISMAISRLNVELGEKEFICVGPGRWGSTNTDLGVFVSYADIYDAGALVELSGEGIGPAPEPSLGTHFFQDLMEAQIYPLALHVDAEDVVFNRDFFNKSPNSLSEWLDADQDLEKCVHLIDVAAYRPGHHLEIVMDDDAGQAVAFLSPKK